MSRGRERGQGFFGKERGQGGERVQAQERKPAARVEEPRKEEPRKEEPRRLGGFSIDSFKDLQELDDEFSVPLEQVLFQEVQENLKSVEPETTVLQEPANDPETSIFKELIPEAPVLREPVSRPETVSVLREPRPTAAPTSSRSRSRAQVTQRPEPAEPVRNQFSGVRPGPVEPTRNRFPAPTPAPSSDQSDQYEYYYDYLDQEDAAHNTDYDLVPLSNKVYNKY